MLLTKRILTSLGGILAQSDPGVYRCRVALGASDWESRDKRKSRLQNSSDITVSGERKRLRRQRALFNKPYDWVASDFRSRGLASYVGVCAPAVISPRLRISHYLAVGQNDLIKAPNRQAGLGAP